MALAHTELLAQARVAVFTNADYISESGAESIAASIESFGYIVSSFVGVTSEDWTAALANVSVLVIPDMFWGRFYADEAVEYVIRDFVARGGTLIVNNSILDDETDFLNDIFNTTMAKTTSGTVTKTGPAPGTTFADDPASLPDHLATDAWTSSGLPVGTQVFYANNWGDAVVAGFQHGRGQVILLGWTWENAEPGGSLDGGWLQVLDSALSRTNGLPTGNALTGSNGKDTLSESLPVAGQLATPFDDIVALAGGNDRAETGAGDDLIDGGAGKDKLYGGDGDDVIGGGTEADKLYGGAGVDDFVFDTKLKKAGLDKLADFDSGVDHLVLSKGVFKKLDVGVLSQKDINKYFDVSGSGKVTYKAGKTEFAFAKLPGSEDLNGDIDVIVIA